MAELDSLLHDLVTPLIVKPGHQVSLGADFNPSHTGSWIEKEDAAELLAHAVQTLAGLQDRLAAQRTYALLVVLQGLDASGKDGLIKHVMTGVNPQGVTVTGFKVPSEEELRHDYLWRHQKALPERGQIGIFNRSHYEEVITVRVHPEFLERQMLPPEDRKPDLWNRRYRDINSWERHLVENGIRIVKLFLNVSRREQQRRLLERIDNPDKSWKFSAADLRERERWDAYRHAHSEMLSETSSRWAPWHVVPADHKWFMHLAAAAAIVRELKAIDPRYPAVAEDQKHVLAQARAELLRESGDGGGG